jgi:hypothetical protein
MAKDSSGKYTIGAMSRYDVEYLKYYTGVKPLFLQSFSGHYTKGHFYNPTRDEFPIITSSFKPEWGGKIFSAVVTEKLSPEFKAAKYQDLYPAEYTLDDLVTKHLFLMARI